MKNIIVLMAILAFSSCSKENEVQHIQDNTFYFFRALLGSLELNNHSLVNTNTGISTGVEAKLYTRNDSSFLELKVLMQEWVSMTGNCNVFLTCKKAGIEASGFYFVDKDDPGQVDHYVFNPNINKNSYPFDHTKPIEITVLTYDATLKFIWADMKAQAGGMPLSAYFRARTP